MTIETRGVTRSARMAREISASQRSQRVLLFFPPRRTHIYTRTCYVLNTDGTSSFFPLSPFLSFLFPSFPFLALFISSPPPPPPTPFSSFPPFFFFFFCLYLIRPHAGPEAGDPPAVNLLVVPVPDARAAVGPLRPQNPAGPTAQLHGEGFLNPHPRPSPGSKHAFSSSVGSTSPCFPGSRPPGALPHTLRGWKQ